MVSNRSSLLGSLRQYLGDPNLVFPPKKQMEADRCGTVPYLRNGQLPENFPVSVTTKSLCIMTGLMYNRTIGSISLVLPSSLPALVLAI
jgi:hypothetical protein